MTWRLLLTGKASGEKNMATDVAMLQAFIAEKAPPTIRFYGWSSPTISFGYAQRPEVFLDLKACSDQGVALVKRPTGGRAIWHHHELTYSVVASQNDSRVGGNILGTYLAISKALVAGLKLFGVDAQLSPGHAGRGSAACFASPSRHEVLVGGKKLIGSAQLRRRGAFLQHGSIPLIAEQHRLACFFASGRSEKTERELLDGSVGLAEVLKREPCESELVTVLARGFGEELGLELKCGELVDFEKRFLSPLSLG